MKDSFCYSGTVENFSVDFSFLFRVYQKLRNAWEWGGARILWRYTVTKFLMVPYWSLLANGGSKTLWEECVWRNIGTEKIGFHVDTSNFKETKASMPIHDDANINFLSFYPFELIKILKSGVLGFWRVSKSIVCLFWAHPAVKILKISFFDFKIGKSIENPQKP